MIRTEFTGMLPGAIEKFEELLAAAADLAPQVVRGYDCNAGPDSYFYWGAVCRMTCDDMGQLRIAAETLGIIWLADDGSLAYTNGLGIEDFKTYRVSGALELMPPEEVQ